MSPRVLAVGYLSIDTVGTVSGRREGVPGGAALYAALGAKRAGANVAIAACAGEDYPQVWLERMAGLGLDVSGVVRVAGQTRRARLTHRDTGERLSDHYDDPLWWERTAALAPRLPLDLAAYAAVIAAPMPFAVLDGLVRLANRSGVPAVADTSEAIASRSGAELLALLPRLSVFAPSREETRILCPGVDDDDAVQVLASRGPSIVQKRGAGGVAACERLGLPLVVRPAKSVTVVDPTGAGDTMVGALAAGLAAGRSFGEALTAAAEVAALTVAGIGPTALGLDFDDHSGWEARDCA